MKAWLAMLAAVLLSVSVVAQEAMPKQDGKTPLMVSLADLMGPNFGAR